MSAPITQIDLPFADGVYTFRLGLAQISELQTKCGAGIGAIYARVLRGRYLVGGEPIGNPLEAEYQLSDLVDTIRLGLIGGRQGVVDEQTVEVKQADASRLVANYVFPAAPLADAWTLTAAILSAAIEGYVPPLKKKEPQAKATARSTTRKRSRTAQ